MELVFNKEGNKWVAEFEAPSDFNLHIEREQVSYINIMQRGSSNGEYDLAKSFSSDKTFDYDFGALVYPKYIKVVSGSEVVSASVNFNEGGGSGSGSSESESSWVFYKFSNTMPNEEKLGLLGMLSHVFSYTSETGKYACAPSGAITQISTSKNTINSIGVDCKALVRLNTGEVLTIDKYVSYATGTTGIKDALNQAGLTEITKEEFYNLDA